MADKHKQVAVKLIKERSVLVEKIISQQQRNTQLEQTLKEEQSKTKEMAEGLSSESQKAHQMEASLEKYLSDFDTEREQLKLKLSREESKNRELTAEVEKLKFQIEQIQRQMVQEKKLEEAKTLELKGSLGNKLSPGVTTPVANKTDRVASPSLPTALSSPRGQVGQNKVFKNSPVSGHTPEIRNVPVVHVRNSTEGGGDNLTTTAMGQKQTADSTSAKRTLKSYDEMSQGDGKSVTEQSSDRPYTSGITKPVPAEKPIELQGSRVNPSQQQQQISGSSVLSMSGGTTVFTTPSGTRISLNVGPSNSATTSAAAGSVRKAGVISANSPTPATVNSASTPVSKSTPPPIPPNKPQVYLPAGKSALVAGVTPVPVQHQTSKLSPRFANMPFGNPRPTSNNQRDVRKPPPQVSLFK